MQSTLDACVERLNHGLERFPFDVRDAYADWLAQTYYYVRHSTRLLATAAGRFAHDAAGDSLHHRFASHMGEEKKHERLALHDLASLGGEIAKLEEHPSTRMFYEPQYFKIEHESPIALFGYILPLEAMAVKSGPPLVARVKAAYGAGSYSFLRVHAEEDPSHVDKAVAAMRGMGDREEALIEANMEQTTFAYLTMLDDMRRRLDASKRPL